MTTTSSPAPSTTAAIVQPRRLGWALAFLATAQLIFALDLNIVFVALPDIGSDLGFSSQSLQWVVGAYAVFAGGFLLLGGRAADLLGRRRVFITALAVYAVSSLAGGLATGPAMIVVARAVQGIGGALLLPSTLAMVTTLFAEGPARNRALAIWGGAGASGLTIGALLGGVLTEAFGWRAVFFVNVPLSAVVITGALIVIPSDAVRDRARRFDLPGGLAGTVAALLLVFAIVQGPIAGWASISVILGFVGAIVFGGAFVAVERRAGDPLLPMALLRNRNLTLAASVTFIFMGTFGALPFFLTVLYQDVHGLSALTTGLVFLIPSISIAAGTQVGERLASRLGARSALLIGFAIGVPGTAVLALAFSADRGVASSVPGLVIMGFGQGIAWTAMWVAASTGVGHDQQGVANGLASTTLSLGNAIGIAVLTAVASATGGAGVAGRADGDRVAVFVAAAAMLVGLAVSFALPGPTRRRWLAATSAGRR